MRRYNPKEIEPKWQKIWQDSGLYKVDLSRSRDKFYTIPFLPYPSGDLHIGHWYNYTGADVVARWHKMLGQNVLTTIGFDAFGLPAENAAIKRGIPPAKWTRSNIESMTQQLHKIGASYDWSHCLATCDPDYYKWNQWLFLQLYKNKLAYRAKAVVNWCPKDKTVLANEQVIGDNNVCERCGTPVVQKEMEQWFFKITAYAERLLADLEAVDWPERVKTMQTNWIGKSQGVHIDFEVDDTSVEHFVLLHGKGGSSTRNFLPWLKQQLEAKGYNVEAPDLPNSNEPNDMEQMKYVKEHCRLDEKTAVVGHSFGGVVALRLLEDGVKLARVALVGTPYTANFLDVKPRPTVEAALKKGFDFKTIKNNCSDFRVLYDTGDYVVPLSDGENFAANLDSEFIESEGIKDHFTGEYEPEVLSAVTNNIRVFTTRPDTIFGATYMVLAPEHPLVDSLTTEQQKADMTPYVAEAGRKTELERKAAEKDKTGVFTGSYAVNPVTEEKIPIWVADYVLMSYGTGAIMAVPAHDERDGQFAKKFDLPIRRVIQPPHESEEASDWYEGEGKLINSGKYNGLDSAAVREQIVDELVKSRKAKEQTNYRLRDWLISRQRYWGTPIPIIYCQEHGTVPLDEKDLPVTLPEDVEFTPTGRNPLLDRPDFVNTTCPKCGQPAKRETDTMDTFVDSSWYYLRYLDNKNDKAIFDIDVINSWAPLDHYIGGIEHAILHLLYARFVTKFFHDYYGVNFIEPFKKLTNNGIILGPDGQKMSKRRGNIVNPDGQVASYGADSLRLYLMFMGPFEQGGPYSLSGIAGTRRFLDRLWVLVNDFLASDVKVQAQTDEDDLTTAVHKTVKKVSQDSEELSFNTAIAAMMSLVNKLYKLQAKNGMVQTPGWRFALETLTKLLAPFAPHIVDEIWRMLGHEESIHLSNWPLWDKNLVKEDTLRVAVQINGKVRAEIMVPANSDQSRVEELAKSEPKIADQLAGEQIGRIIYVPERLINFVL